MKKIHTPDDFNGVVLKNSMGVLADYNVFLRNGRPGADGRTLYEYHSVHGYRDGINMKMLDRVTIFDRYDGIDDAKIRKDISEGRLVPLSEAELADVSRIFFSGKRIMTRDDYRRIYAIDGLSKTLPSPGYANDA